MHAVAALPELPPLPRLLLRLLLLLLLRLLLRLLLLLGEPTMPSARRRGRSHSEMTVSAQDGSGEAYVGLIRSSPTCLSSCAHDLDEGGMLRYEYGANERSTLRAEFRYRHKIRGEVRI